MHVSGISKIYVSTKDIDRSLTFYRDTAGMKVVSEDSLAGEEFEKLWNLPKGMTAKAVSLQKGEQPTFVSLVRFDPCTGEPYRAKFTNLDYGIYDIAFRVKDIEKCCKDLERMGFSFISSPTVYSPPWSGTVVKEAVAMESDSVPIALIQRVKPPLPEELRPKDDYGIMADSAQTVENMDETLKFYRDILGFNVASDKRIQTGFFDSFLKLPPKTSVRLALTKPKGSTTPYVELLEKTAKGKTIGALARAPNLGIFLESFETDDIKGLKKKFTEADVPLLSPIVKINVKPQGKIEALTVEGPNKVMLEFYQKL